MNGTYFKAATTDGIDFHTGTVHWLPAEGEPIPEGGWLVEHPNPGDVGSLDAAGYLSASTVETDCTGFSWPGRLLSVEPIGTVWTPHPDRFPRKRAAHAWRVTEELPAWRLFGPQGRTVAALIEHAAHLTITQIEGLTAAWPDTRPDALNAAWVTAWVAAPSAARVAALDAVLDAARGTAHAAWYAAQNAAWGAVLGWLVKDLISVEDFRTLTGPWESVMGPIEVAV